MYLCIYIFFCPHKHVYNRKKLARRTDMDYIDQIRIVATALNNWENNDIFIFLCIRIEDAKHFAL